MSISPDNDTDPTKESDSKFNAEPDSDVNKRMEDDLDAMDGVDFAADVDDETIK